MSELIIQFKTEQTDEIKEKIKLQKEYTLKNKLPLFTPSDGICWCCHRQIYDRLTKEYVSNNLITGCPLCNITYCD